MKETLVQEFERKLNKILETVPKEVIARKIEVAPRTVRNWFDKVSSIKLAYAEKINKLYDEVMK